MDSRISSDLPLTSVRTPALPDRTGLENRISSMPSTFCLYWPIIRFSKPQFVSGRGPKIPPDWMICSFVGSRQAEIHSHSQPRCWSSRTSPTTSAVRARPPRLSCGTRSKLERSIRLRKNRPGRYSTWSFARSPCTIFGRETQAGNFGFPTRNRSSGTRRFEIGGLPGPGISRRSRARTVQQRSSYIRMEVREVPVREPRRARRHERS